MVLPKPRYRATFGLCRRRGLPIALDEAGFGGTDVAADDSGVKSCSRYTCPWLIAVNPEET